MITQLDELAETHGIQIRYIGQNGQTRELTVEAKETLLRALGVDLALPEPGTFQSRETEIAQSCFLPDDIARQRRWGVTCQLYALRSARNLGIGDFEDLAKLAELSAAQGADFLGVSPLHALFLSDAGRYSPYSPSTRRYLNPLFIAVDQIEGGAALQTQLRETRPELFAHLEADLVDYPAVARVKKELLQALFDAADARASDGFEAFCRGSGEDLRSFALFEAISAHEVAQGGGSGWLSWPGDMQQRDSDAVRRFEAEHERDVQFHLWLQWVADQQLEKANQRAKEAGMRIGLYLDFAVGVAPDGQETWADPELAIRDVRVGSPPDLHNSEGQDWGLAPLSPPVLAARSFKPLRAAYLALMKNAGAIRIDHVMGLARLWWVPASGKANGGGYVRYPFSAMIDTVAQASQDTQTLVIGEDLGTVPEGFREAAAAASLLSYRVVYFEKDGSGNFIPPDHYPERSLASISTHDLATLAGWWQGSDITLRQDLGRQTAEDIAGARSERASDRAAMLRALEQNHLLDQGGQDLPEKLDETLFIAIHRLGARSRSMLFAVQLDDLLMSERQPNLPGTTTQYPNWSIRLACPLEELGEHPMFNQLASAMREERPKP